MENSSLKFSDEMLKKRKLRFDVDTQILFDSVMMASWIQSERLSAPATSRDVSEPVVDAAARLLLRSVIWNVLINLKFLLHIPTEPLFFN